MSSPTFIQILHRKTLQSNNLTNPVIYALGHPLTLLLILPRVPTKTTDTNHHHYKSCLHFHTHRHTTAHTHTHIHHTHVRYFASRTQASKSYQQVVSDPHPVPDTQQPNPLLIGTHKSSEIEKWWNPSPVSSQKDNKTRHKLRLHNKTRTPLHKHTLPPPYNNPYDYRYRIECMMIVERLPTVMKEINKMEEAYILYSEARKQYTHLQLPKEFRDNPIARQEDETPDEEVPIETLDDKRRNYHSLNREFRNSLYFVVKYKNSKYYTFPTKIWDGIRTASKHAQTPSQAHSKSLSSTHQQQPYKVGKQPLYDNEKIDMYVGTEHDTLRDTAEGAVRKDIGADMSIHILGNAPIAVYQFDLEKPMKSSTQFITPQGQGEQNDVTSYIGKKEYMYHAAFTGNTFWKPEMLNAERIDDYLWLTKEQLLTEEYLIPSQPLREILNDALMEV